jgi:hypothetical protein
MKKVKFTGKLSLNKETVTKLNDAQMGVVKGGEEAGGLSWFKPKSRCCGSFLCCPVDAE